MMTMTDRYRNWEQLAVRAMQLVESKQEQIEMLKEQTAILRQSLAFAQRNVELQEWIADEWEQRYLDEVENGDHAAELARLRNGDPYEYLRLEDK